MISLAAWMTVATLALSKLRTTKRPRWPGGTGGAVGGCGIGAGGLGSTAGWAGVTVRGPTDVGGSVGRGSGPGGGGVTATGGGVTCAGGRGLGAAHPEASANRTTMATKRLTLVLRRQLRVVGVHGRCREPSADARRGPRERRGARRTRRRLSGLYQLCARWKHAGSGGNAGRRLRDRRRWLNGARHRDLPRQGRLARDRLLARGCRSRRLWLRRVAKAHVDHAVR